MRALQGEPTHVDPRQSTDCRSERRRTLDVARQVPADMRHVATPRRRRVPASLRLVDAERRPAAATDRRPIGRQRPRASPAQPRRQHGRQRLLRPQRRLGADLDDGGRPQGRVPVLSGQEVRRRHLLVPHATAIERTSRGAKP